ncbi:MAG: terpene cyclase/mutase family protein [Planctomycetes bacterium]|nr:terpene cyclase/mutase family protein [Planctomycetota bacterium]
MRFAEFSRALASSTPHSAPARRPARSRTSFVVVTCLLAFCGSCITKTEVETGSNASGRRITHCSGNQGNWIVRAQGADGSWRGGTDPHNALSVTGLVLLGFTGAGESDLAGSEKSVVSRGLAFILNTQAESGLFVSPGSTAGLYEHAVATLFLAELLRQRPDRVKLRVAVERALHFSASKQLPEGLWSVDVDGERPDRYASSWMLMSAWSAGKASVVDDDLRSEFAVKALMSAEPEEGPGDSAPPFCSPEAVAAAIKVVGQIYGEENPIDDRSRPSMEKLLAEVLAGQRVESPLVDPAYWYLESVARGVRYDRDEPASFTKLVETVVVWGGLEATIEPQGNWEPLGKWSRRGGRAYAAAMFTLAAQLYYRFDRVFGAGVN